MKKILSIIGNLGAFIVTLPSVILYWTVAIFRYSETIEPFRHIERVYFFTKAIYITDYFDVQIISTSKIFFADLGVMWNNILPILIFWGILGTLPAFAALANRNDINRFETRLQEKVKIKTRNWRIMILVGFLGNILGLIGLILYLVVFIQLGDHYPDLKLTFFYYGLSIGSVFAFMGYLIELIKPMIPYGYVQQQEREKKERHKKRLSKQIYPVGIPEEADKPLIEVNEETINEIKKLLTRKEHVTLTWLEDMTEYPTGIIIEILTEHLNARLAGETVIY